MSWIKETLEYLTKFFQWWVIIQPWETGLRVRLGNKVKILESGIHFRIPFIDLIYSQTDRLRIADLPLQTVTSRDGKTLSIKSSVGYSISNIKILYETLYNTEGTICNIVMGEISDYVSTNDLDQCVPSLIEETVKAKLNLSNYGIKYEYVKIIGYAVVRTYRLIGDQNWFPNELSTSNPK